MADIHMILLAPQFPISSVLESVAESCYQSGEERPIPQVAGGLENMVGRKPRGC